MKLIKELDEAANALKVVKQSLIDSDQIKKACIANGMRTLRQDGIQRAMHGVTSLEEVLRVTNMD